MAEFRRSSGKSLHQRPLRRLVPFILRYKTFSGGPARVPYTVVEVKDSKPFTLKLQRRLFDCGFDHCG